MRSITLIVIHCSATPEGRRLDFEECRREHMRNRHFKDIGYHYYITRDGTLYEGRSLEKAGAHCRGHNRHSIGICYEGGLDAQGKPCDTRTARQKETLARLLENLKSRFKQAIVVGHKDLNPQKECPCFDATVYN